MNKKEKIIYLAGIIDGEGCVKFKMSGGTAGNKKRYPRARCVVTNTSKKLIYWLKDNFGGNVRIVKREELKGYNKGKGNRKTQYHWRLRYGEIKKIFPQIIPYLIIKKKEAKQSLALIK